MNGLMKTAMLAAALAIVACDKPQDAKPADPATTTATNAAPNSAATAPLPATTAAPTTIADTDLSSPADFEPEAESTITAKNYKAEIATIETEMSKE